jgi:hypothetical protein
MIPFRVVRLVYKLCGTPGESRFIRAGFMDIVSGAMLGDITHA